MARSHLRHFSQLSIALQSTKSMGGLVAGQPFGVRVNIVRRIAIRWLIMCCRLLVWLRHSRALMIRGAQQCERRELCFSRERRPIIAKGLKFCYI